MDAILTSGNPGDKSGDLVFHVVGSWDDEAGNQYVWYLEVYQGEYYDNEWEQFDEEYVADLQEKLPDPVTQRQTILEFDVVYVDPESYDEGGIGYLGLSAIVLTLDGLTKIFRPEPTMVFRGPAEITVKEFLDSVCRFNGLTYDDQITVYSKGLLSHSTPEFKDEIIERLRKRTQSSEEERKSWWK